MESFQILEYPSSPIIVKWVPFALQNESKCNSITAQIAVNLNLKIFSRPLYSKWPKNIFYLLAKGKITKGFGESPTKTDGLIPAYSIIGQIHQVFPWCSGNSAYLFRNDLVVSLACMLLEQAQQYDKNKKHKTIVV